MLNVVGLGTTFAEARDRTYRALGEIALEGGQHRTDIARASSSTDAVVVVG